MKSYAFAWITSLLIATVSLGEVQTVKIQNGNAQGSGVICGGTSSGSHRVVLSVAHVTGTRVGSQCVVTANGREYWARLIGADRASDSALLVIGGRHLEDIPSARLWLWDIRDDVDTVTEGYAGGQFVRTLGRAKYVVNGGRQLEWSGVSYPGMSGGPTWYRKPGLSHKYFLSTTTGSDFHTMSIGPYRTWFHKWVPTLSTKSYRFTCADSGEIEMFPRSPGAIEGPIAIPEAPPETLASNQPTPAKPKEPSEDLNEQLKALLQEIPKTAPTPKEQPSVMKRPAPTTSPDLAQDGDVITINVPIKLRIKTRNAVEVEVID